MTKSLQERMEYFYNKLEDIIESSLTPCESKIKALNVYCQFFPMETTITTTNYIPDTSMLSKEEKIEMKALISKAKSRKTSKD